MALFGAATFMSTYVYANEYETFDGHVYNGKMYPRIDIIEWNEGSLPSHMEFQNYNKSDMPVEMSFQLEEKNGRKVMLVRYTIHRKDGDEVLCRRVIAPGHFKDGLFMVYKDNADSDREIIMVSMFPLPEKKGRELLSSPVKYATCEMPSAERMPAGTSERGHDSVNDDQKRVPGNKGALKKNGDSVPFGDW